ncbi:helix-turn-helix transcriptional regulator [Streptomyces sp. QH1-20]|uniref:helix-turn-helix domain-containing protein n=1 Tax=Streptomyces sp. QH1-20 TaxID=3240934 RepID=UPI0035125B27
MGTRGFNRDLAQLTKTEVSVLEHLAEGLTTREVAETMGITPRTLGGHLAHIRDKLIVTDRPVMVHAAYMGEQLQRPDAAEAPGEFTQRDHDLWNLLATKPLPEIGQSLKVSRHTARGMIKDLTVRAGARSETHVVKLGHAYGILGAEVTAR